MLVVCVCVSSLNPHSGSGQRNELEMVMVSCHVVCEMQTLVHDFLAAKVFLG